ncbi:MAG: class I SAM-dependent methyltransferase [Acidimicrobiaceae bacterium]|nr:class I SAM-dependent methyltransferase [Acidimicrobiaceae bacterium]
MPRKWTEDEAAGWLTSDAATEMLDLPRRIAASIVATEGGAATVADIASGPGTFLKIFLDMFPESTGIWHDASETMRVTAQTALAQYGPRISWVFGDMYNISASGLPTGLDVVMTSRATHHLTSGELATFYAEVCQLVRPKGWIINLDHAYLGDRWDATFRSARKIVLPKRESGDADSGHRHERPAPSIADHTDALAKAGITTVQTAWQAYYTFLLLARKP